MDKKKYGALCQNYNGFCCCYIFLCLCFSSCTLQNNIIFRYHAYNSKLPIRQHQFQVSCEKGESPLNRGYIFLRYRYTLKQM